MYTGFDKSSPNFQVEFNPLNPGLNPIC